MSIWRLVDSGNFLEPAIPSQHSQLFCLVSIFIAIIAASQFIPVIKRYHHSSGKYKLYWLVLGSCGFGIGVWAMHFTAMLSFQLPIQIDYDRTVTAISVIPVILGCAIAIYLSNPNRLSILKLQLAALALAIGIGAMHYIGMEAIIVNADMYYQPNLFVLSILAAYFLASLGLALHFSRTLYFIRKKIITNIFFGLMVSTMHFIAMSASYFQPNSETKYIADHPPPIWLIIEILAASIIVIAFVTICLYVDGKFKKIQNSLESSENKFNSLANSAQIAIFTCNRNIHYANQAMSKITGFSVESLIGSSVASILGEDFSASVKKLLSYQENHVKPLQKQFWLRDINSAVKWIHCSLNITEIDDQKMIVCSAVDITLQKETETKLHNMAYYDPLTKTGARTLLLERLTHNLDFRKQYKPAYSSAIYMLDLDNFKSINDDYGHQVGDQLLIYFAEMIKPLLRKTDTLARFGGDEFAMLFEKIYNKEDIITLAERIIRLFTNPVAINDIEINIGISIGIAIFDNEEQSADEVLMSVDIALHKAKSLDVNKWAIFDDEMDRISKRRRQLHCDLKTAILNDQFHIYYQPIFYCREASPTGFEALIRWNRNDEWISPGEFIPIAEETGLIHHLSLSVLRIVSRDISRWKDSGLVFDYYISINVVGEDIMMDIFHKTVRNIIQENRLKPGQLKLELTERMLMKNTDSIAERMRAFIELGCDFMLDDFGTGYSSLSYLPKLPISTLKIDQSFIRDIHKKPEKQSIVKSIIALAHSLDMDSIAEGIENEEEHAILRSMHCEQVQGYLFGKPVPENEVIRYIQHDNIAVNA